MTATGALPGVVAVEFGVEHVERLAPVPTTRPSESCCLAPGTIPTLIDADRQQAEWS